MVSEKLQGKIYSLFKSLSPQKETESGKATVILMVSAGEIALLSLFPSIPYPDKEPGGFIAAPLSPLEEFPPLEPWAGLWNPWEILCESLGS